MAPLVYRSSVALIWTLTLWNVWWARGLFVDGHSLLLAMLEEQGFVMFFDQRLYLMVLTQVPALLAIKLGVKDTELLARLLSLGLFVVPTAFYYAALFRARRDPLVLAAVVGAIAVVYMPTSFFIAGEFNSLCAIAIFTATLLATGERLTLRDGLLVAATALLALRSYELTAFLGPLLAGLVAWRVVASGWRTYTAVLYALAAILFVASGVIGGEAMINPHKDGFVGGAIVNALNFWRNLQFVLPLIALAILAVTALAAPRKLQSRGIFLWPAFLLVVLAASPLLWLTGGDIRPFPKAQYESRIAATVLAAIIAVAIVTVAAAPRMLARSLETVRRPEVMRSVLLLQFAALLAALPVDLFLTELWRQSEAKFQETIVTRRGFIPAEETVFVQEPYRHFVENWTLPTQSLVLRRKSGDAIVLPPKDYRGWQPFEPTTGHLPDTRGFYWRDPDLR